MKVSKLCCAAVVWVSTSLSVVAVAGEKIDQVLDVSATGQVNIENMRGEVEIIGWDKNKMAVSGELDDRAEGYVFETDNGFTRFKVKMPRNLHARDRRDADGSKLKIYIPNGSDMSFESVNGNVSVTNVFGGSNVNTINGYIDATGLLKRIILGTINGDIKVSKLDGKIKISTVNGRVVDKDSKGKVTYTTVNGSIESKTQASRVYVENVNGEITLDLKTTEELEVATVNGDIEASVGLLAESTINITTVSGDARLKLSGAVGGQFRLSAHGGGKIKNDLTDDVVQKEKYGPARDLKFNKSGGNARVEMTTVSGHLTIE